MKKSGQNKPAISVIVTVLNEGKTIDELLQSLTHQTLLPAEVVICDGGSTDTTQQLIKQFSATIPIQLLVKKGNRSVGRNAAIAASSHEVIAITDAGCVPQTNWLEELWKEWQRHAEAEKVVAGYYEARAHTSFESAVAPYFLVMPDKAQKRSFLPATRSMMISKQIWEKLGRFNEQLSDNEDYAFAHKMIDLEVPIYFAKNAIVSWLPPRSIKQFSRVIYRFARGDAYSGILRPKVVLIFGRYLAGGVLILWLLTIQYPVWAAATGILGLALYFFWAINKNYRYAQYAWYWLPVLQIVSDLAVMAGSTHGLLRRLFSTSNV